MGNLKKEIAKCKHPNSRKTIALIKKAKKFESKEKVKLGQHIKQNLLGEKLTWFRDNLEDTEVYTSAQLDELFEKYLSRFDEELEQIALKRSIGGHRNHQHASRQDTIRMTLEREREEYMGCGIEMIDIRDPAQLKQLRNWEGELRLIINFKLKRIAKKHLL
ncbi:translation machinery-associated protein 16 homolog isoform X2 [Ctenocephalides felis]|uniref:translation machinery-associated protein 16 homolog isoform X2 n=1 Tax=Ctenocephalides felis TaxID=7515 RepID=UPI000E6E4004|nr:translation machinery-associated protein 16 homolog isoform X2 [Ctenocephalides felis]